MSLAAEEHTHLDLGTWRDTYVGGRYRVEACVGQGGMGAVYRVVDESTGKKLALKRLAPEAALEYTTLFEREYHTLASLKHRTIIEAFEYGTDDDGPYYTMELLEGSDVSCLAPLPWREVCSILRDVATALSRLHARSLLHRDVSASNVWRTTSGAIKLIDFGAIAPVGTSNDVIGTPPFIAPEVLDGDALDARSDLYALGALGYFLLTGRHAYAARTLADLELCWRDNLRAPSKRAKELERTDLPLIPTALDNLIEALLSADPGARPRNAVEVIDRLGSMASLPAQPDDIDLVATLGTTAFVGRSEVRYALTAALERSLREHVTSVVIEGESGAGRSRLLAELALQARMTGATVLHAQAMVDREAHGFAAACALRLLDVAPERARQCAEPFASVLGRLSPRICELLEVPASALSIPRDGAGEARIEMQTALRDWFLDVAKETPLVILADDIQNLDDGSAAWLVGLAKSHERKLLVVAALRHEEERDTAFALQALRQASRRLDLAPLAPEESHQLVRSIFGEPPNLRRLADLLHRSSEGNPGHAIELAQHLVQNGTLTFEGGTWLIPNDLELAHLPVSRSEMLATRLARLKPAARELARKLSARRGALPLELCVTLSGLERSALFGALENLVKCEVLIGSSDGYRFYHDSLRITVHSELDTAGREAAHRTLGRALAARTDLDVLERLQCGVHLLHGDDWELGSTIVVRSALDVAMHDPIPREGIAPAFEEALACFEQRDCSERELLPVIGALAIAGYYVDRRYTQRLARTALEMFSACSASISPSGSGPSWEAGSRSSSDSPGAGWAIECTRGAARA